MAKAASFWEPLRGLFSRKDGGDPPGWRFFKELYGGRESKTGVNVTWQRALEVSVVLACVRVLAEGVSQVPFKLYQEQNDQRAPARDHPVYRLITRRPNKWQTSFEFRETLMFHLVLAGNAFVFLNRVGSRREIREMIPIEPGRVEVKQGKDYSLTYKVSSAQGISQEFPQEAIWHIRGPSWNSWMGMEAVKLARESIGLSIALEEDQAMFHKNGAQPAGVYSMDGTVSPEKYKFLAEWIDKYAPGGERHMKPMILDLGAKFTSQRMTGVDAQQLESRKFQAEETCRPFRVLPIMIGLSGDKNATFASAEQMFLAHVMHTLTPWYVRIEQSAEENLLTDADREKGLYFKFIAAGLLRGAAKERAEYFKAALGHGGGKAWMTQNEVRAVEELDKIDDPEADKLAQPPQQPDPTKSKPPESGEDE